MLVCGKTVGFLNSGWDRVENPEPASAAPEAQDPELPRLCQERRKSGGGEPGVEDPGVEDQ